ncbi:MAG TPA: RNA polymerase sigma factor [Polyangia bacterium]|nr:RNA polymerase sigma factor [Polyangia bacterium]
MAQAGNAAIVDPLFNLACAATGGDARAMRRLIEAVIPGIRPTLFLVLGRSDQELPDVEQECLIALRQSLRRFRGESSLMQYVRQLALRRALTARARRWRRARLVRKAQELLAGDAEAASLADPVVAGRRAIMVRDLLDKLPAEQAQALALRVLQGLSPRQIARVTCSSVNTVRSRVRLAKEKLRARILTEPGIYDLLTDAG